MQIKTLLTGLTQNVLLYIYFEDENEDEDQQAERTNLINETLLKLFFLKPLQANKRYNENNYGVFCKLKLMPRAQKAIAKRLCDPVFLLGKFPEWCALLAVPKQCTNLVQMIGTFDKATQTLFYKNLSEAMHKSDQIQPYTYFLVSLPPHFVIVKDSCYSLIIVGFL